MENTNKPNLNVIVEKFIRCSKNHPTNWRNEYLSSMSNKEIDDLYNMFTNDYTTFVEHLTQFPAYLHFINGMHQRFFNVLIKTRAQRIAKAKRLQNKKNRAAELAAKRKIEKLKLQEKIKAKKLREKQKEAKRASLLKRLNLTPEQKELFKKIGSI